MTNTADTVSNWLVEQCIEVTVNPTTVTNLPSGDWRQDADAWSVVFERETFKAQFNFFTGSARTDEPLAADVLNCLLMEYHMAEEDFVEFCDTMGHDGTDGVSPVAAIDLFAEITNSAEKMTHIFTVADIDDLTEMLDDY